MSCKCSTSSTYIILIKCECFTDFKDDPELHVYPSLRYVGIELWQVTISPFVFLSFNCSYLHPVTEDIVLYQVKSGTLFDNVLVSDDPEYAKQLAEETWGKQKDVCGFFLVYIKPSRVVPFLLT